MKLAILISILALASPLYLQGAQRAKLSAQECLTKGKRHIAQKQLTEAVSVLRRCKQITPSSPHPYFFSGIALAESGRLIEAASELAEAVRLGPAQPEYALSYVNVLSLLKQKYAAVKVLARFENKEALAQLGTPSLWLLHDINMRLLREDGALQALERISQLEPKNPRIHLQRGRIYKLKGNLELAEASFRKALQSPATSAAAHFELGKILEQRNETQGAKGALVTAVRRDPANAEYLYGLGSICLALGEVEEAIRHLEQAEPFGKSFPQIYYALGQAYLKKGEREKGAAYLKKVHELNASLRKKEIDEQEELTLVTLGEERLDQGKLSEAEALFERTRTLNPKNWHANEYLAKVTLYAGEWQRAEPYLSVLEEIDAFSFEANFLRALYWYQRLDDKQARDFAMKAMAVQPQDAELRNLLGDIYLGLGLTAKAIAEYSLASKLAPDRSDFREDLEKASKLISPAKPARQ
jgi:Flp pilus assembly protein TadD